MKTEMQEWMNLALSSVKKPEEMKKTKIGTSYYRRGHNCSAIRKCNIYEINGFAYAKDSLQALRLFEPLKGELTGYVPVNKTSMGFIQVGVVGSNKEHTHL